VDEIWNRGSGGEVKGEKAEWKKARMGLET
jgi:hypothetical protein